MSRNRSKGIKRENDRLRKRLRLLEEVLSGNPILLEPLPKKKRVSKKPPREEFDDKKAVVEEMEFGSELKRCPKCFAQALQVLDLGPLGTVYNCEDCKHRDRVPAK